VSQATAFAPATVANVAVGFDCLGFAVEAPGDRVTVERVSGGGVEIASIEGVDADRLPLDPARNSASVGLVKMAADLGDGIGFRMRVRKGIPLSSGLGGSAASAVAAVVAANALLDPPLPRERLLDYALLGEQAASGSAHADNAAPCLYGGLVLVRAADPPEVVTLPVPASLRCVLVHPHARLDTRASRAALPPSVALADHVRQAARLAAFVAGCHRGDLALIARSLEDVLIEPHRAPLIHGFASVKRAALEAGALGCSISGSGPSVFALCDGDAAAERAHGAMLEAFARADERADGWISPIRSDGARIES